ncbi:hypothetical protein SLEP1_g31201 [Rubroshorea leprosula]|uniref:Uncharacterized protein n=1 Tax=Rubroshorea leprosula TaxID=152421 RepID=A0AAV5K2P9_9ROSI|nr:hypothetical protein SLEP1_g31201 [Rubroshorea leprosula]
MGDSSSRDGSSTFPSVTKLLVAAGAAVVGLGVGLAVIAGQMGSESNANGENNNEERMMKAPGGGGTYMPRKPFEDDPKGYFRDLRAGKKG